MDYHILLSIKEAANWLVSVRKSGQWQDLVYKKQGIINTCEAWHTLAVAKEIVADFELPDDLFIEDLDYLTKEVKKHGFLRTPYQPGEQTQESTDVAAFVALALAQIDKNRGKNLIEVSTKWLLKNQSALGGWSWGVFNRKYPMYPYFTYMAMVAIATIKNRRQDIKTAIANGTEWLVSTQRPDGSFPVYDGHESSDVASTAYALLGMLGAKTNEGAIKTAVEYLLSLSYADLTCVGNLKIVEPEKPPQMWVNYENYAVPADVLLALVKALPHVDKLPQIHERIQFLVQYLLNQKEEKAGWPRTYSTIYVTHTCVEALVAYWQYMQSYPDATTNRKRITYNPYIFGFPIHNPKMFFGRQGIIQRLRWVLENITFRSDNRFQPIIEALSIIKEYLGTKYKYFPVSIPIEGVVTGVWAETVLEGVGAEVKVNRKYYELCVLQQLERALRCKEIWVEGSYEWRNPSEDLPSFA